MSFVPLERLDCGPAGKERFPARATLVMAGKAKAPVLQISVDAALLEAIGASRQDRFDVLVGQAEAHGLIRLRKAAAGIAQPVAAPKGDSAVFKLGRLPGLLPQRREKSQGCKAEKVDICTIEIVLPRWVDETDPRRKAAQAAQAASARVERIDVVARAAALPADVAPALMGDPAARVPEPDPRDRVPSHVAYLNLGGIKFSAAEAAIVECLHKREVATRAGLMAVTSDPADPNDERDEKVIDVWMSRMKPRLAAIGVAVESIRGTGFRISRADKKKISELLEERS